MVDAKDTSSAPPGVTIASATEIRTCRSIRRSLPALRAHRRARCACPHDCPDTCALDDHGRERTRDNGRRRRRTIRPRNGVLCTKVARYLDRTYSSERVLHPLAARRPQGRRPLRAHQLGRGARHDRVALQRDRRFAGRPAGDPPVQLRGNDGAAAVRLDGSALLPRSARRCSTARSARRAGKAGYVATIGASIGTDLEQFENARLILIWGSNPIVSNLHLWSRVQEAKRRGAKLIAIDPYRSHTAEKCHEHLALLPGTDAALALGMMHVLIAEDLLDHDYIARYTLGFDALKERLNEYPPERVAAHHRPARRTDRRARARLRHDQAGGDPPQLRHAAPRRRRHGDAHGRLPAGARRRVARSGRRRPALLERDLSDQHAGRSSGRT